MRPRSGREVKRSPRNFFPNFNARQLSLVGNKATIGSTMFEINIDRSEPVLLHDQVAGEIRRAIAQGEAGPGDRLPLATDIAAVLGVNKNTVLRALRILREEGIVEFRRGRGITVAGTPQRSALLDRVRELLEFARSQGYRPSEVIELIETVAKVTT